MIEDEYFEGLGSSGGSPGANTVSLTSVGGDRLPESTKQALL